MTANRRFENKTAVVTGGGSGIGRAIALGLAREGAAVAIADMNADAAAAVTQEIGGRAIALTCDVRETAQVEAMMAAAAERLGRLDILVNNAGVVRTGPVASMADEDIDVMIGANLRGAIVCARAALEYMIPQRYGAIVSTASGLAVKPAPGAAVYGALKAAIIHLTQSLALEVAPYGVRVNSFAPGMTDTPLWRGMRSEEEAAAAFKANEVGQPEDFVPTVLFLCSDDARDVSGVTVPRQVYVVHSSEKEAGE